MLLPDCSITLSFEFTARPRVSSLRASVRALLHAFDDWMGRQNLATPARLLVVGVLRRGPVCSDILNIKGCISYRFQLEASEEYQRRFREFCRITCHSRFEGFPTGLLAPVLEGEGVVVSVFATAWQWMFQEARRYSAPSKTQPNIKTI